MMGAALPPGSSVSSDILDGDIRDRLADSLQHICDVFAANVDGAGAGIEAGLADVRSHRIQPGVFGRFYDLVFACRSRAYDEARTLLREIVAGAAERPTLELTPFNEIALRDDMARYGRLIDFGEAAPCMLASPDPSTWRVFAENVAAAWKIIDAADPALSAEIRGLVIQVVGAAPSRDARVRFRGASSLMLWGALFMNVESNRNPLECAETLVHEAAHGLLFGLSRDEPLVLNAVEERFASPLRAEPRPMDGVFHATFVCARVHYFYSRLKAAGALDVAERLHIDERLTKFQALFQDGVETVRGNARLTGVGDRLLSAAATYMRDAA